MGILETCRGSQSHGEGSVHGEREHRVEVVPPKQRLRGTETKRDREDRQKGIERDRIRERDSEKARDQDRQTERRDDEEKQLQKYGEKEMETEIHKEERETDKT